MKQKNLLLLTTLCVFLPTVRTKCAAEAQGLQIKTPEYFDVEAFVEKIENGELTDDEIRESLDKQNPPRRIRGEKNGGYNTNTPAIQAAANINRTKALATLIRLGADLEKTNQRGFTPLMAAAEQDNQEAADLLVQAGVDLNFQGFEGCTALICATKRRQLAATQSLIYAKADLDIQDRYKQTALIKSVQGSCPSPRVVRALLNAKADTSIVDHYGRTAYAHAIDPISHPNGGGVIAQMLLNAGAPPEKKEKEEEEEEEEEPKQTDRKSESAIVDAGPEEIWV